MGPIKEISRDTKFVFVAAGEQTNLIVTAEDSFVYSFGPSTTEWR